MIIDPRRKLVVPGDYNVTLAFCADHFSKAAQAAIKDHGGFFVALSGGSTPKAIFERLSSPPYNREIPWSKVHLFWSDERAVSPESDESNYHMAMQAGLKNLPIPKEQIHRMCAEVNIEENARSYEMTMKRELKGNPFDLIMLGMGEDGHTASLFPGTQGLEEDERLVTPNFIPDKNSWRMSLTFPCLNTAHATVFYVLGASKRGMLQKVLQSGNQFPAQRVGTKERPALWIADEAAASFF